MGQNKWGLNGKFDGLNINSQKWIQRFVLKSWKLIPVYMRIVEPEKKQNRLYLLVGINFRTTEIE